MEIIITLDRFLFKAKLHFKKDPETYRAILEKLPIKGTVI
jgi:hypothetical protein